MPSTIREFLLPLFLIAFAVFAPVSTEAQEAAGRLPIEVIPNVPYTSAQSLALSPDGTLLVSGGFGGSIALWDFATGRLLRTFLRHSKQVRSIMFLSDGKQVLSASEDMTIKLWDAATGRLMRTTELRSPAEYWWDIKLSPDGTRVLTGQTINGSNSNTRVVKLWDVASGRLLRTFRSDASVVAFSPNGTLVLSNGSGTSNEVNLWDAATGRLLRTFVGHQQFTTVKAIAMSPDGRRLLSAAATDKTVKLWDATSGRLLQSFALGAYVDAIALSPDGRRVLTANQVENTTRGTLRLWDVATGQLLRSFPCGPSTPAILFTPDGARALVASGNRIEMWDTASGKSVRAFGSSNVDFIHAQFSNDGTSILSGGRALRRWDANNGQLLQTVPAPADGRTYATSYTPDARRVLWKMADLSTLKIIEAASGRELATLTHSKYVSDAKISSDGSRVLSASYEDGMKLWDAETGRLLRTFKHPSSVYSVAFSPDGARLLSGTSDGSIRLWDAASGQLLWTYKEGPGSAIVWSMLFTPDGTRVLAAISDRGQKLLDAASGRLIRAFSAHRPGFLTTGIALSRDGSRMLSSSHDGTVKLWDVSSGHMLRSLEVGHRAWMAFSPDGRRALLHNEIWNLENGERVVSIIGSQDDQWLTITPEGYFTGSQSGAEFLSVVRGFDVWSIDQFYQSLYRPDLVREKLAGDPRGLVREAAAKLDLNKVLASGNAPAVMLVSPREGTRAGSEQVTAEVEIADKGGGIGRVEWRVNGITVAVENAPAQATADQPLRLTRAIALDEGDNEIEVVAYNSQNLIASLPARAHVTGEARAGRAPARLYVLAIGLNDYADADLKLAYAVPDAQALAEALGKAGKGLYENVEVTLVQDANVNRERLAAAFNELAGKVRPTDVFAFFIAGHGKTIDGRYYFIPRDFKRSGTAITARDVQSQGIAQEQWQAWFAGIPARKSVLIFDTCESGTLTGDSRETELLARGAANDRLAQATGRSILTASSGTSDALEGYRGHGLFTYNLLEALERADSDGNGTIEMAELATYVYANVIALSMRVFKEKQEPQIRITSNYPLAKPAHVLGDAAPGIIIPPKPTHQIANPTELLVVPTLGARRVRKLDASTPVTLVNSEAGWTLIARDARVLGYVASRDLAPLQ